MRHAERIAVIQPRSASFIRLFCLLAWALFLPCAHGQKCTLSVAVSAAIA